MLTPSLRGLRGGSVTACGHITELVSPWDRDQQNCCLCRAYEGCDPTPCDVSSKPRQRYEDKKPFTADCSSDSGSLFGLLIVRSSGLD